jgi:hypothetical protein
VKKIVYFSALLFVNGISAMNSDEADTDYRDPFKIYTADEMKWCDPGNGDTFRVEYKGDTITVDAIYDEDYGLRWRGPGDRSMVLNKNTGQFMFYDEQYCEFEQWQLEQQQQEFRERRNGGYGFFYDWPQEKEERYQQWQLKQEQEQEQEQEQQEFQERREWLGGSFYGWPQEKEERYQRWQLEQERYQQWQQEQQQQEFRERRERRWQELGLWKRRKLERRWQERYPGCSRDECLRRDLNEQWRLEREQHELGENDCVCEVY